VLEVLTQGEDGRQRRITPALVRGKRVGELDQREGIARRLGEQPLADRGRQVRTVAIEQLLGRGIIERSELEFTQTAT
jgi:hypothetical protein